MSIAPSAFKRSMPKVKKKKGKVAYKNKKSRKLKKI